MILRKKHYDPCTVNVPDFYKEIVLWRGRPEKEPLFADVPTFKMVFMFLLNSFFLLLTVISLFAILTDGFFPESLLIFLFLAIGLYMLPGQQLLHQYEKKETEYVVTDKRIYRIIKGRAEYREKEQLYQIYVKINKDRTGTFYFDCNYRCKGVNSREYPMNAPYLFKLEYIKDVNRAYSSIIGHPVEQESILWEGRPQSGHYLTGADWLAVPLSIFLTGFCLIWPYLILSSDDMPWPLIFIIIPFAVIAVHTLIGRFILLKKHRKYTSYVITDCRIIRKCKQDIDFMDRFVHPPITVKYYKNGDGSIYYGSVFNNQTKSFDIGKNTLQEFALENIKEAGEIYDKYLRT
ncbi:MAG: hypothetical protein ACI4D3_13750 [Lachnospiraceae bacterium]